MNPTPIADILELPHGAPVMPIAGTIRKVQKPKTGNNEHGDWSIQRVTIDDGTGTIDVTIFNHGELPTAVIGAPFTARSEVGQKSKRLEGIDVEHYVNEKTGAVTVRANVRKVASVEVGDGSGPVGQFHSKPAPAKQATAQTNRPAPKNPAPASQTGQTAPAANPPAKAKEEKLSRDDMKKLVIGVSMAVGKMGNGYKICLARAQKVADWHADMTQSPKWSIEAVKDLATTFFIQAQRDGIFVRLPDREDVSEFLPSLALPKPGPAK